MLLKPKKMLIKFHFFTLAESKQILLPKLSLPDCQLQNCLFFYLVTKLSVTKLSVSQKSNRPLIILMYEIYKLHTNLCILFAL